MEGELISALCDLNKESKWNQIIEEEVFILRLQV